MDAEERQDGTRKAKQGKDDLPFSVYVWLCRNFLTKGEIFGWAYLTMCWNLMSRTNNVAGAKVGHFSVLNDAIGVYLPKTKADQGHFLLFIGNYELVYKLNFVIVGDRSRKPIHVYANPKNPVICPVLALGCYLIINEYREDSLKIFLGGLFDLFKV